jgi:hypothetical protein
MYVYVYAAVATCTSVLVHVCTACLHVCVLVRVCGGVGVSPSLRGSFGTESLNPQVTSLGTVTAMPQTNTKNMGKGQRSITLSHDKNQNKHRATKRQATRRSKVPGH